MRMAGKNAYHFVGAHLRNRRYEGYETGDYETNYKFWGVLILLRFAYTKDSTLAAWIMANKINET